MKNTTIESRRAQLTFTGRIVNQSADVISPTRCLVMFTILGPDGSRRRIARDVCTLLGDGDSNTKLAKNGSTQEFATAGLSLAPALEAGLRNMCPHAGACATACLDKSGMGGVFESIHIARIQKTIAWQLQRDWFKARLITELSAARERARTDGLRLCVRLNVFSDVAWEKTFPALFEMFSDVQFYDYTKNPRRVGAVSDNYWVTFSRDENNEHKALEHIRAGRNASIVFNREVPSEYLGFPVISGDDTDLRFTDPRGVWIGLTFKGTNDARAAAIASGFCVDLT